MGFAINGQTLGNITAQETHFLLGLLVCVFAAYAFPGNIWALALGAVGLLAIALWKEYFWDPVHELNQPFFPEGELDLLFYLFGVSGGLFLVLLLHNHFGLPT